MVWQQFEDILARIPFIEDLQTARDEMAESVWIVGGSVRDLLLGQEPADVDLTCEHPEPLARRFAGLINGHVVPMDPERGIWRVAISANKYFDFCAFRDSDLYGDLRGRDFTINAIALHLPEEGDPGGLFDPFNGLDDLNNNILRMVNRQAFRDDPARILRAFRFLSELNLQIDDDTWGTLRQEVDRLPLVAVERLLAEWWKLCAGVHAAAAIQRMDEADVLTTLFPELQAAKGVVQNAYHHLDVWEHMLLATTYMARFLRHPEEILHDLQPEFAPILQDEHRRARLVFLALIHDMGKPVTRSEDKGKVHFYRHESVGAEMAEKLCRRLRVSREDTRVITSVIRHHLRPLHLMNSRKRGELSRKAMIKFFDETGDTAFDIMLLALADKSAGQGAAADPDVQEQLRDLYRALFRFYHERYQPALEQPLITGSDLTQQLHLPAGPQIGDLLHQARDMQILGELNSHAAALRWAKTHRG